MDQEFLDLYNRELHYLNDQAAEFAAEFPGIADRLGGLLADAQDPLIAGLLEGTAFLAARVQLKLKHEFHEFTSNYLDQILPNYLAPLPSALLARIEPPFTDPGLRDGVHIGVGSYLDATYVERDHRIACRYQLRAGVTLWPFDIMAAVYLPDSGSLDALGIDGGRGRSGMRLTLTHRVAKTREDEPDLAATPQEPQQWFAGCRTEELAIHILGKEADAILVYEQIFSRLNGVFVRHLDRHGDPVVHELPREAIVPVGFSDEETLLPRDHRIFRGFERLQEYFLFPETFLGFRVTGLKRLMPRLTAKTVDLVFAFEEPAARLAKAVSADRFALYAAPAINLFEKTMDRVAVRSGQHEYHVVPDRSRMMDFEPHRITAVFAHSSGGTDKIPVSPLYSSPSGAAGAVDTPLYYAVRRLPRRRTTREREHGAVSDYTGTDLFISLSEPPRGTLMNEIAQLSIRGLCSNRHLAEQLPVGEGGADFRLLDHVDLRVFCVAGPTRPRPPVLSYKASREEPTHTGVLAWKLVNALSLNQLGLAGDAGGREGRALKEILSFFADPSDPVTRRRIRGIRSVESKPVVRRLRHKGGVGVARGLEVTVTVEEKAFEGSGAYLFGVVLERFFAEYVGLNRFTETVLRTVERGEILRGTPRLGERPVL